MTLEQKRNCPPFKLYWWSLMFRWLFYSASLKKISGKHSTTPSLHMTATTGNCRYTLSAVTNTLGVPARRQRLVKGKLVLSSLSQWVFCLGSGWRGISWPVCWVATVLLRVSVSLWRTLVAQRHACWGCCIVFISTLAATPPIKDYFILCFPEYTVTWGTYGRPN
jgi:hypothetical protein